ncbi:hypothetical protein KSS87_007477, partial [Heliosperma pusillum]
ITTLFSYFHVGNKHFFLSHELLLIFSRQPPRSRQAPWSFSTTLNEHQVSHRIAIPHLFDTISINQSSPTVTFNHVDVVSNTRHRRR